MQPATTAFKIAMAFLVVSVAYILSSDWLALEFTNSAEQLRQVQSIKGAIYVAIVSVGLFGLAYLLLRRIERQILELQIGREALLNAERRTLAGTLAASIAHDVNNLLGAIQGNIDYSVGNELGKDTRAALDDVLLAINQLMGLNSRLISAARAQTGHSSERVDLSSLLSDSLAMLRSHTRMDRCQLELAFEPTTLVYIEGFPGLISTAVVNLVLNGAEASPGGHIRVSIVSDDETASIIIEDDGPGIDAEVLEQIQSPFFTTKEHGSGLGLFSVAYCAERHHGEFDIGRSELGGAMMTLRLPIELPTTAGTNKPENLVFFSTGS